MKNQPSKGRPNHSNWYWPMFSNFRLEVMRESEHLWLYVDTVVRHAKLKAKETTLLKILCGTASEEKVDGSHEIQSRVLGTASTHDLEESLRDNEGATT